MWELDHKESWVLKNRCFWTVVLEKTLESHLDCKKIKPVHPKGNQSWIFIGRTDAEAENNTLATWYKELIHWKNPWCWEILKAGGGDDGVWDGWMTSPTQWTWVWASSGSWWWTGKPHVLQSIGSQRVGHVWANEMNWTDDSDCLNLTRLPLWPSMWSILENVPGFRKLNWTRMGKFNSSDHYIYYCGQESLRKWSSSHSQQESKM